MKPDQVSAGWQRWQRGPMRAATGRCLCLLGLAVLLPALELRAQTVEQGEAAEPAAAATEVVDKLHEKLLDVMRSADELAYRGRYRELAPILGDSYDTPLICKVILGDHWKQLSETQRMDFIDLFTRLSIATYADRFNSYDGESFALRGVKALNRGRMLVKTELLKADGRSAANLDYLLHSTPSGWRIISVIAQGVNDLSLKRTEYGKVMREQNFPRLLAILEQKLKEAETEQQ